MEDAITKNNKKWFIKTVAGLVISILVIVITNIVVDPYFHFHKPITAYRLDNERYINDGIARHFEYDAIITGNSLMQNFKPSMYDTLFNANSVKLTFSGAGYKELWTSLGRSLTYNKNVSKVLIGMDFEDLARGPQWQRYNDYPEYLYDTNVFNDVEYVLNLEILYHGTFYNLLKTVKGEDSTSFDEYSAWERPTGAEFALAELDWEKVDGSGYKRELSEYDLNLIYENINLNILPVIEANPEVEFVLLIPPSSIAKWARYSSKDEVEWVIDGWKDSLPLLLSFNNVKIYGFDDVYELTHNLERYSDEIHYDPGINEWLLQEIASDNHRITLDNYKDYFEGIKKHYSEFDYGTLK